MKPGLKPAAHVPVSFILPGWVRSPRLSMLLGNELRVVFPVAVLALLGIMLSQFLPRDFSRVVSLMCYAVGCAAVSSVIFGHDFAHRTLVMTLGQPVSREVLWVTRLKCAGFVLGPLFLVEMLLFLSTSRYPDFSRSNWMQIWSLATPLLVPLASAICLAPWFTLLCRSPLAGTVFSIALPFLLFFGSIYLGSTFFNRISFGQVGGVWQAFCLVFAATCVAGFIGARKLWSRIEAIEPLRVSAGSLFRSRSAGASRRYRRSPWIAVAAKEFRLQWITLAPALAMFVTAVLARRSSLAGLGLDALVLATIFWTVAVCVIAGAVGSAEERQLGITESQALQPMAQTAQWLTKGTVLLGTVALCGVLLPLSLLTELDVSAEKIMPASKWWAVGALLLSCISLHVSSCCRTTMKAVLVSLPFSVILLFLLTAIYQNEIRLLGNAAYFWDFVLPAPSQLRLIVASAVWVWLALVAPYLSAAALVFVLMRFACRNHFSAESGSQRVARQAGLLILWFIASLILCFTLTAQATI